MPVNIWDTVQKAQDSGLLDQAMSIGMTGGTLNKPPFSPWQAMVRLVSKSDTSKEIAKEMLQNGENSVFKKLLSYTNPIADGSGTEHMDEILGLNRGHALWRAKQNWPDMDVEIVGKRISPTGSGPKGLKY